MVYVSQIIVLYTFNLHSDCVRSRFSHVRLFVTLWTVAHQAPLSIGFSRQEYWSGLPCPSPGGHSRPRDRTRVSYISCMGRRFFTTSAPWEAVNLYKAACQLCLNKIGRLKIEMWSVPYTVKYYTNGLFHNDVIEWSTLNYSISFVLFLADALPDVLTHWECRSLPL